MDLREEKISPHPHPWELARYDFVSRHLRRFESRLRPGTALRCLDVGSGDAWFANRLASEFGWDLVCVDAHYTELDCTRLKVAHPKLTFVSELPDSKFDVILALDVLEHVDDEQKFLRSLRQRMSESAKLVFTVPAWQFLWSQHDLALGHFRRYEPARLKASLEAASFSIEENGGFFASLLLPRMMLNLRDRLIGLPTESSSNANRAREGFLSYAVEKVLRIDARLSVHMNRFFPVPGLSLYAICSRKE